MLPIKIVGVTNADEMRHLINLNIFQICFDLRPKSLTFIPHERVISLINQFNDYNLKFGLILGQEKPFMFDYLIKKIQSSIRAELNFYHLEENYLELDFKPSKVVLSFEQFTPDIYQTLNNPFSIEVDYESLIHYGLDQARERISNIERSLAMNTNYQGIELKLKFNQLPSPILLDFYNISSINFIIDSSVWIDFQQLNYHYVNSTIKNLRLGEGVKL
jgi:hypothetical protein